MRLLRMSQRFHVFLVTATLGAMSMVCPSAWGQVEAYSGRPFGVGRVSFTLPPGDTTAASIDGMAIADRSGRVLYPVFTEGRVLRILGQILGGGQTETPDGMTVFFLFTGDAPLDLTISTPQARSVQVVPRRAANSRAYERLRTRWWREYCAKTRQQAEDGDYPPIVQTYLTSMLSRRLGLTPPLLSRVTEQPPQEPMKTFELVTGVESLRLDALRQSSLGRQPVDVAADLLVPDEIQWEPLDAPPVDASVDIEPIAQHVPRDWFYIRFGNFKNYLWLDKLQRDNGGDLSRMLTLRGFDAGLSQRMQRQLALKQSALAEVVGPTVISDVALVGRDLFLREGAALGMLFEARSPVLGVDLNRQRAEALQENAAYGATLETVQIAGRDVSLLATPANRVRSFYVVDGNYHLVTTSRAMVEQFLQVAGSGETLAASNEFQHARAEMPTDREDTIFVFFSSAFFQGLLSPHYQIELRRRLQAITDLELIQLAAWAARTERKPADSIASLIDGDLLPQGFGRRADGSEAVMTDDGGFDSMRGRRGSFTPIPDIELNGITRTEAERLNQQAQFFGDSWPQMDPLMIGVKRYALDDQGKERIIIDANVSPFAEEKYGWIMSILGPPTSKRITPAPGDIISAQASVRGGMFMPSVPLHHLFVGIQDSEPLTDLNPTGLLKTLKILQTTPGYLGAWPKVGFLDLLPLQLVSSQVDAAGFSQLPLGVWRRQWDAFSALSMDPNLLARVTPHIVPEQAEDDAQIRIHVGDLSQAKLQTWVNNLAYYRASQASMGNAKLLHTLSQQLSVPRPEALQVAQYLLDAKLVCSLNGRYYLDQQPGEIGLWKSDRWTDPPGLGRPADYSAPVLEWFRGMEFSLTKYGDRVVVHAQLDMQRKPGEPKIKLPSFFNMFGGDRTPPANKPLPEPPREVIEAPKAKKTTPNQQ